MEQEYRELLNPSGLDYKLQGVSDNVV